ncbi:MAG: hypothetical protein ABWY11_10810 [Umezawaea sp.]
MDPPQFTWPGGRKVAVMITAAVELWSEGHWPSYAPRTCWYRRVF